MLRNITDAVLPVQSVPPVPPVPPVQCTRSIASQTRPEPARHHRQTQTEPHLCLHCHTAQLAVLLEPGRPGLTPAWQDDFASGYLSPVPEQDEPVEPPALPQAVAASTPTPSTLTPAEILISSLLRPDGNPMPHVLRNPDLLRTLLGGPAQSFWGRTAE